MKINDWVDCISRLTVILASYKTSDPRQSKSRNYPNKKYEDPILNKSYQEMADYYDTTIIPTRVRKHHTVNLILPCFLVDLYYVLRLKKDGLL